MMQIFLPLGRPQYILDSINSTRHSVENGEVVFPVEQGTRFYAKFTLTASPMPTGSNLYKNGQLLQRSPFGTIYLETDSVEIRSVQKSHEGNYTISCVNVMGEGRFSFRLRVVGMCFKQKSGTWH